MHFFISQRGKDKMGECKQDVLADLKITGLKEFMGMDVLGYNLDLWYKGRKIALVQDGGNGGMAHFDIYDGCQQLYQELSERVSLLPMRGDGNFTYPETVEWLVDDLINEHHRQKEFKKLEKKGILLDRS